MIIFLIHLLLMALLPYLIFAKRSFWPVETKLLSLVVTVWATLILASNLLACFTLLSNNVAFISSTLLIQVGLSLGLRHLTGAEAKPDHEPVATKLKSTFSTWYKLLALLSFCVFALMTLIMALRTTIQIPDTLAMKLPNAYFYLQSGSLVPPLDVADEGRMFSAPLNGLTLWMYLIRFHQHWRMLPLFNWFFWLTSFLATYRLCRLSGSGRWSGFSAAALLCLTQNYLFQAQTDNDDLLSSFTGTIGAVYFVMWLRFRTARELALAAIAIGISVGAKFFPALYLPAILICSTYYGCRLWFNDRPTFRVVTKQLILAGLVIILFCGSFFYIRAFKISSARNELLTIQENSPFRASTAKHNIAVYNLQLFLSPIVDGIFPRSGHDRTDRVNKLNKFSVENLVPNAIRPWAYMPGVKIAHEDLYDNTVWFGFLSWAVLFCIASVLLKRSRWFSLSFWLAVFFISWDLFFCVRIKYIEELGRYWLLPMSLMMPVLALAFDQVPATRLKRSAKIISLSLLWGSTIFCAFIGLKENPIRLNFVQLWNERVHPPKFSNELVSVLETCPDVNVLRTVYGYPVYWNMRQFKGSKLTYLETVRTDAVNVIPALDLPVTAHFYDYKFFPIDLGRDRGGIKFFGDSGLGFPFYVLPTTHCDCQASCPKTNSQLIVKVGADHQLETELVKTHLSIIGLLPEDKMQFRVIAEAMNDSRVLADWSEKITSIIDVPRRFDRLVVQAREVKDGNSSEEFVVHAGSLPIKKR